MEKKETHQMKSFWPERLKEVVKCYWGRKRKYTRMETLNDFYDLDQLKEEDIPELIKIWGALELVYEGPTEWVTVDNWKYFALREAPFKVDVEEYHIYLLYYPTKNHLNHSG